MRVSFLLLLFPIILLSQTHRSRSKGHVFKSRPETPYENVNSSGLVVVKKGVYGLTFEDRQLPESTKKRVENFFKRRLNGYTDLKTYHLKIYKRQEKWYIDNTEI